MSVINRPIKKSKMSGENKAYKYKLLDEALG